MVTSSNNKRHWRWWRCKKLTKQNAIKKTDEIKTAVMIRGVKAPNRSQVTKLDYVLWCRQEQVIRNVSNVTEMSEMSPLVVWKDCTMEVEKRKFTWQKQAGYSSCLEVSGENLVNCLSTNQGSVTQGRYILNGDTFNEEKIPLKHIKLKFVGRERHTEPSFRLQGTDVLSCHTFSIGSNMLVHRK